jgi:glycosyltransferase involved in cell wall biosynthesis
MKPKVLMAAYACNPEGTGEYWLGWGWALQASRNFDVHLLTPPFHRAAVESRARAAGIEAHFVPFPDRFEKAAGPLGRQGAYLSQILWHCTAGQFGLRLHRRHAFALAHHTTFHTFRIPLALSILGIPTVWGPIAGAEFVPNGFYRYLGPARWSELIRHMFNKPSLLAPPTLSSLRRAGAIFVSNTCTFGYLPPWCQDKCTIVPPNATHFSGGANPRPRPNTASDILQLLFVGNCTPTRAIPLLFDALRLADLPDYRLTIVGSGSALGFWQQEAHRQKLAGRLEFVGSVPQKHLDAYYASADLFVFPSLRDSGGSALLEAMLHGIPVLCLDWGGPGEMVDQQCAVKIPIESPSRTVQAMAAALTSLSSDPTRRQEMAAAAIRRARSLFDWSAKRQVLEETYRRLISTTAGKQP